MYGGIAGQSFLLTKNLIRLILQASRERSRAGE